jgi:hypothetical protein
VRMPCTKVGIVSILRNGFQKHSTDSSVVCILQITANVRTLFMQAGKTATVYALAKELGYQILEVRFPLDHLVY